MKFPQSKRPQLSSPNIKEKRQKETFQQQIAEVYNESWDASNSFKKSWNLMKIQNISTMAAKHQLFKTSFLPLCPNFYPHPHKRRRERERRTLQINMENKEPKLQNLP